MTTTPPLDGKDGKGDAGVTGKPDDGKGNGKPADPNAGLTGVVDTGLTGDIGITGDKVDMDKLKEIIEDRNAKGKETVELKAKLAELTTQMEALKPLADAESARQEADKSELEKVQGQLADLTVKLETAITNLAEQDRTIAVTEARVKPEYVETVATMLEKAKAVNKDLDVPKYFEGLKEKSPVLFGEAAPEPAVDTSGGPAAQGDSDAATNAQIDALEKQLKEEKHLMTRQQRTELIGKIESLRHCRPKAQGGN